MLKKDLFDPEDAKQLREFERGFDKELADLNNQERNLLKNIADLEDASLWKTALNLGDYLFRLAAAIAARVAGAVVLPNQVPYDGGGA